VFESKTARDERRFPLGHEHHTAIGQPFDMASSEVHPDDPAYTGE